jgi:hypothetical protein
MSFSTYNNNDRVFSIPQGQIRESTGLLDSYTSGLNMCLYKNLLQNSRLYKNGTLLPDTSLPICQARRTKHEKDF